MDLHNHIMGSKHGSTVACRSRRKISGFTSESSIWKP